MKLESKYIEDYARSRSGTYKAVVCHAPFVNLNFEQNGNVRACCYNTKDVLGAWPVQSIRQIWESAQAATLRKHIRNNNLGGGCLECGKMIVARNHQGVRAKYFDEFAPNDFSSRLHYFRNKLNGHINYPRVMEFELSNECNLECIMCNGYFSSSIRKNRENLPPSVSPYNDQFVDELEEFIPHLTDAKFLGGEPFMIDIYLKIWERILKINPNVRIHITTNGTFLNSRVKQLLEGLKAGIILSIDSVNKETYQTIRVNGNYDKVMQNLDYLLDYTRRKRTFISIAACPIIHNWKELPGLLEFCIQRNIALYLNAVFSPAELSLREQTVDFQQEVVDYLLAYPLPAQKGNLRSPINLSINAYKDFVNLLKGWLEEKKLKPVESVEHAGTWQNSTAVFKQAIVFWSFEILKEKVKTLQAITKQGYVDKEVAFLNDIANLFAATPNKDLEQVLLFYLQLDGEDETATSDQTKAKEIAQLINQHPSREAILIQMAQASPVVLAQSLKTLDVQNLTAMLNAQFG